MNKIKCLTHAKIAVQTGLLALLVVLGCGLTQRASAIGAGDADTMINGYNSAFLVTSGNSAYYKVAINNGNEFGGNFPGAVGEPWEASIDILAAEDAYERTGSAAHKTLVYNLCATWLRDTPPGSATQPWSWDGWNDDIGWHTMALARGYQITGNTDFLTAAENGFNYAFNRGWDTRWNGGGIWEQQIEYAQRANPPGKIDKETISNDSLGIVACLLYQSSHDVTYLNKAKQIYGWMRGLLYDPNTGQVYTGVIQDGTVDRSTAVYNQGTFVDYANYLYQITGDRSYYNDAKRAIDFTKDPQNKLTTDTGLFSNNASYLDTWADTFARGLGHFVRDNRQWSIYYPWMVQNANAIMSSRRTDYNITWNGWTQPTPADDTLKSTQFASAVAWLQFTPATQPSDVAGVHAIVSQQNGIAIDNGGLFTYPNSPAASVSQWGLNYNVNQKWNFTQNADLSWNILSESSWQALDDPGGSTVNGTQMVQWPLSRASNQCWWVDQQPDGSYKIWNQASGSVLDNSSSAVNGHPLVQWGWGGAGATQQRWFLQ